MTSYASKPAMIRSGNQKPNVNLANSILSQQLPTVAELTAEEKVEYLKLRSEGHGNILALFKLKGVMSQRAINAARRTDATFAEEDDLSELLNTQQVEHQLYLKAMSGNIIAIKYWLNNRSPDRWADVYQLQQLGNMSNDDLIEAARRAFAGVTEEGTPADGEAVAAETGQGEHATVS